jgi:hypothetical protein
MSADSGTRIGFVPLQTAGFGTLHSFAVRAEQNAGVGSWNELWTSGGMPVIGAPLSSGLDRSEGVAEAARADATSAILA